MSKARPIYHFSSTVLYNEVFDPREDLIISLVRTNEEQDELGALRLQGGTFGNGLLELEPTRQNPTGTLNYNFSNEFENLCLYIFDASVDASNFSSIDGPSRSTAVSAFDVAPVPGNIFLSGGNRYYKNLTFPPVPTPTVLYDSSNNPLTSITTDIPDNMNTSGTKYVGATRLEIGNTCTTIGFNAFLSSPLSGELVIPGSVTYIDIAAFGKTQITSLVLNRGLVEIDVAAFYETPTLSGEVVIPDSVRIIEDGAFADTKITSITIPRDVTRLGGSALENTPLTAFNCYADKSVIDAAGPLLLASCPSLTEVHALATDSSWTEGPGQTIGGKSGIEVIKDLTFPAESDDWEAATAWIAGDGASEFRYTYDDPNYGGPLNGWEFRYTAVEPGSSTNCFYTTVSSASGLFPWELPTWYVTNNSSNTYELSAASTVDLTLSGFTSKNGISVNEAYKLDGPGASILTDLTQPIHSSPTSFGTFLSGALVLACVDNGGAFSLSGSQEGFYNSGTETLSSKVFSVRALSALQSTRSAELCTFDFKGAVVPEDSYATVDERWKLLRVGFKRNLQDVVLYVRENGIYETQQVFSTGFNLEQLPAGIKVGISYSGHMPMEIQNLTINGILTSAS